MFNGVGLGLATDVYLVLVVGMVLDLGLDTSVNLVLGMEVGDK